MLTFDGHVRGGPLPICLRMRSRNAARAPSIGGPRSRFMRRVMTFEERAGVARRWGKWVKGIFGIIFAPDKTGDKLCARHCRIGLGLTWRLLCDADSAAASRLQ